MVFIEFYDATQEIRAVMKPQRRYPKNARLLCAMDANICNIDLERPKIVGLHPAVITIRDNASYESILHGNSPVGKVLSNPLGPARIRVYPNGTIETQYWLGGLPFLNLDGVVFVPKEQRQIYATLGIDLWRGYTYPTSLNAAAMMRAGEIINGGTDKCRS